MIVTANNKIVPDSYPYFLTTEWADLYRARRIEQLLKERDVHSVESFKQIQGDVMSLMAADLLPLMLAAPVKAAPRNPEVTTGRVMLSGWDGSMKTNRPDPLRSDEHPYELPSPMPLPPDGYGLQHNNHGRTTHIS